MPSRRVILAASLLVALSVLIPAAFPADEEENKIDPQAAEVMRRFGEFAAGIRSFSVRLDSTLDSVDEGLERSVTLKHLIAMQKPDKVRVEDLAQDRGSLVVNDGKTLTLYLPSLKKYQTREALPHAEQAMSAAGLGGVFLAGLFAPDPAAFYMEGVVTCRYLGQEQVGGRTTDHLTFIKARDEQQQSFNWEVWFGHDDPPLPLRMVPDFSGQGAEAEFAYAEWQVNTPLAAELFTFKPPEGAEKSETLFAGAAQEEAAEFLGKPAPQFKLPLLGGGEADLARHAGKEIVLLDFWATWCGVCRQSMPSLSQLALQYKDKGVVLYAVNGDPQDDEKAVRAFMEELKISPAVALDKDGAVSNAYGIKGLPTMVMIGKDGTVQAVHEGVPRNVAEYAPLVKRELDALLAGKKLVEAPATP